MTLPRQWQRHALALVKRGRALEREYAVKLSLHIDLADVDTGVAAVLPACLDTGDLSASQQVGEFCRGQGVQGILYPSAIAAFRGTNLVVFRDVAPQPEIVLVNRDQILEELRRLSGRLQS